MGLFSHCWHAWQPKDCRDKLSKNGKPPIEISLLWFACSWSWKREISEESDAERLAPFLSMTTNFKAADLRVHLRAKWIKLYVQSWISNVAPYLKARVKQLVTVGEDGFMQASNCLADRWAICGNNSIHLRSCNLWWQEKHCQLFFPMDQPGKSHTSFAMRLRHLPWFLPMNKETFICHLPWCLHRELSCNCLIDAFGNYSGIVWYVLHVNSLGIILRKFQPMKRLSLRYHITKLKDDKIQPSETHVKISMSKFLLLVLDVLVLCRINPVTNSIGWPLQTGQDFLPNHAADGIDYAAIHFWWATYLSILQPLQNKL